MDLTGSRTEQFLNTLNYQQQHNENPIMELLVNVYWAQHMFLQHHNFFYKIIS
jgi:hypothetical protein